MKNLLSIFFTLIALNAVTQNDTATKRHDWREQFKKNTGSIQISNMVPDSVFTTVKKKIVISGNIKSICKGNDSHWVNGPVTVGVIIIYSSKDKLTYCILTSNKYDYNYAIGDSINIKVAPLTKKDKYFKPRQYTCDAIQGEVICIAVNK